MKTKTTIRRQCKRNLTKYNIRECKTVVVVPVRFRVAMAFVL